MVQEKAVRKPKIPTVHYSVRPCRNTKEGSVTTNELTEVTCGICSKARVVKKPKPGNNKTSPWYKMDYGFYNQKKIHPELNS
jgi:hypothetical protein